GQLLAGERLSAGREGDRLARSATRSGTGRREVADLDHRHGLPPHPPIALIERSGCTYASLSRPGWPMPWAAGLSHIACCHIRAMTASDSPARRAPARSNSSWEKRHERTRPSAVMRVRVQAEQNGSVTEAMTPT